MKKNLILLSDLNGLENQDWLKTYLCGLEQTYSLQVYDSCVLAGILTSGTTPEERHKIFISGGIEKAVENLMPQVPENAYFLGFSIGGILAWKTLLKGISSPGLWAVSATRLRYEHKKPDVPIGLYYGEEDRYRPAASWFKKWALQPQIVPKVDHEFYRDKKIAKSLIETLLLPPKKNALKTEA